ncbi:hypothetical protein ACFYZJ_32820 [Streptomyces sp. NPDC001848]|uniref:hypothetical protein n=1 Tax=Streptomyces sp. NPDC001848 TaxID=3364618 RepID=UPI0036CC3ADD
MHHHGNPWTGPKERFDQEALRRPPHPEPPPVGSKYCKAHSLRHYYGSRLLYARVPEGDVADWMGHGSTDVLREHYHHIFEGAEQRGRAAIATMLTPGADDPTEASEVA